MAEDAVVEARTAVESLARAVERVATAYGDTLGVRRLQSDVNRLRDDLLELGDPKPGHRPPPHGDQLVEIDDNPYDENLWADSDSEAQHAQ